MSHQAIGPAVKQGVVGLESAGDVVGIEDRHLARPGQAPALQIRAHQVLRIPLAGGAAEVLYTSPHAAATLSPKPVARGDALYFAGQRQQAEDAFRRAAELAQTNVILEREKKMKKAL